MLSVLCFFSSFFCYFYGFSASIVLDFLGVLFFYFSGDFVYEISAFKVFAFFGVLLFDFYGLIFIFFNFITLFYVSFSVGVSSIVTIPGKSFVIKVSRKSCVFKFISSFF